MSMEIAPADKISSLGGPSMWIEWGNLARQNKACNLGQSTLKYIYPYSTVLNAITRVIYICLASLRQ